VPKKTTAGKRGETRKSPPLHVPTAAELMTAFAPMREARRKIASLRYPPPPTRPARASQELPALVAKAGVDLAAFETVRVQHDEDLRRAADQQRMTLIKQSSATKAVLARDVAIRRKLAGLLPAGPRYPYYQTLEQPLFIWATSNTTFSPPHIEPHNSWAKFKLDADNPGFAELGFYFTWTNPGNDALINADAYLVLNGSCEASVPSGYGYGALYLADLYLVGELDPWLWGESPVEAPRAYENVLSLRPHSSSWWPVPYSSGEIDIVPVFRGYDLRAESLVVPKNGVMVFEVLLNVFYWILEGHVVVDFASDAFDVLVPAMLITVLGTTPSRPVATTG